MHRRILFHISFPYVLDACIIIICSSYHFKETLGRLHSRKYEQMKKGTALNTEAKKGK